MTEVSLHPLAEKMLEFFPSSQTLQLQLYQTYFLKEEGNFIINSIEGDRGSRHSHGLLPKESLNYKTIKRSVGLGFFFFFFFW